MGILNFFFHSKKKLHSENNSSEKIYTTNPESTANNKVFAPSDNDIEVLMRLNSYSPKATPEGIINAFSSDIHKLANQFIQFGYLKKPTLEERLYMLTIPSLKEILRNNNLPVSGKKAVLLERIKANIPEEQWGLNIIDDNYYVSPKGTDAIKKYKEKRKVEELAFNKECIKLILHSNIRTAYYNICIKYAYSPIPHGLGVDWGEEAQIGIEPVREKILSEQLNFYDEETDIFLKGYVTEFNACVILCSLLGLSPSKTISIYKDITNIEVSSEISRQLNERAYYQLSIINSLYDIQTYTRDGITKFEVLCCNGSCQKCKKAAQKHHLCKTAKIGKTLPPFHKGCRCTTVAYFND